MGSSAWTRRRFFGGVLGALAGAGWRGSGDGLGLPSPVGPVRETGAHTRPGPVRIGVVVPARSGASAVQASLYDFVGEAARRGAILAEDRLGVGDAVGGWHPELLLANAPSAGAAVRAAERLATLEGIVALVGGLGEGQAEALHGVAVRHGIPFVNIGTPMELLPEGACTDHAFHLQASAEMYIRAMVAGSEATERRKWCLVYERSHAGLALRDRALGVFRALRAEESEVPALPVVFEQPVYRAEIEEILERGADAALLLLDPRDQGAFLAQADGVADRISFVPFPHAVSQSREYFAASRRMAPRAGIGMRAVLWEATLGGEGMRAAAALNGSYLARWGEPMDPSAWAAYQGVSILLQAARAGGSADAESLLCVLADPHARFEVAKGERAAFRPADWQLLQPLYLVTVAANGEWGIDPARRLGVATLTGTVPAPSLDGDHERDGCELVPCGGG